MENANVLSVGNRIVLFDGSYLWRMRMSYLWGMGLFYLTSPICGEWDCFI